MDSHHDGIATCHVDRAPRILAAGGSYGTHLDLKEHVNVNSRGRSRFLRRMFGSSFPSRAWPIYRCSQTWSDSSSTICVRTA